MSSFAADWLALREPLDAASRAQHLGTSLIGALAPTQSRNSRLRIIDLGAGTGANLRYLAPLLGAAQNWLLVENDPALLGAMAERMRGWAQPQDIQVSIDDPDMVIRGTRFACCVSSLRLDLATQLQQLPLAGATLLTASALLDLVSESWLRALARCAAAAGAVVYFALTYDGRMECHPQEAEDQEVRQLFNLHQLGDKGFGAALGPGAGRIAEQVLTEQGYDVHCALSAWCIGPGQATLQHALVTGWFEAACEAAPHRASALHGWLARRRSHIDAARSELRVGHVDMVGRPPQNRA